MALLHELLLDGEELAKSKHLTARASMTNEARAVRCLEFAELSAVQEEMQQNYQLVIFVFVRVSVSWS